MDNNLLKSILYGVAVGDALGVPVEFEDRKYLKKEPVTSMQSFGTHDQPSGVWSDDTSLTLCLADTIAEGFDLQKLANKFIAWKDHNLWTATGWVFDIGIGTRIAIENLADGVQPEMAGGASEKDNGNGSLMRILPLLVLTKDLPIEARFELTKKVSSVTHAHIRSVIACFYYLEFAKQIATGRDKFEIYETLKSEVSNFLNQLEISKSEIAFFDRLLVGDIFLRDETEIESSGYVVHTLEASIWCLLTTTNYKEAVLKAVNLGDDTDTTGAVTGGLAGLLYGFKGIPKKLLRVLRKVDDINQLIHKFQSTQNEFEIDIVFEYGYTGTTDCDVFTDEFKDYTISTKVIFALTNQNGNNTLKFNYIDPASNTEQEVEIYIDDFVLSKGKTEGYSFMFSIEEQNKSENFFLAELIVESLPTDNYHIFNCKFELNDHQMELLENSTIYVGKTQAISE